MAYIFPPDEADWGSKESKVARFLHQHLNDEFYIFLNFKYFDAKKDVSREGDLLILCNEGFLVIEIKENLEFYNGRFVQKANPPRVVQPVEQAEDSLQGFLDLISEDLGININLSLIHI